MSLQHCLSDNQLLQKPKREGPQLKAPASNKLHILIEVISSMPSTIEITYFNKGNIFLNLEISIFWIPLASPEELLWLKTLKTPLIN